MGFADESQRPLLSSTPYHDGGHQRIDDETRAQIILNVAKGNKTLMRWITLVSAIFLSFGLLLLLCYFVIPMDGNLSGGIIVCAGEFLLGPVAIVFAFGIVFCLKRSRVKREAELLRSTEGIVYEWTYSNNQEYRSYVAAQWEFNRTFYKELAFRVLIMFIPGTLIWGGLSTLSVLIETNPAIIPIIFGQFFKIGLPFYTLALAIGIGQPLYYRYHRNLPFAAWKDSCIFYSNGTIYHYGTVYSLQANEAPLREDIWNVKTAKIFDRVHQGERYVLFQMYLLTRGSKGPIGWTLQILVPTSLHKDAEDMMKKVAQPYGASLSVDLNPSC